MKNPNWTRSAFLLPLFVVAACSAPSTAVFDTARAAIFKDRSADSRPLDPNFRYLRIATADGRVALVVLGYLDPSPGGPIEVWYSAEREALRLQNGRVVGAAGLPTEWHNVSIPRLPSWNSIATGRQSHQWIRTRDVLPGYRVGIRDRLSLRRIEPPSNSELKSNPLELVWFEERDESLEQSSVALLGGPSAYRAGLPPARYAVRIRDGVETVIYGEQCLSAELCFSWQRWPAESAGTPARR